MTSNNTSADVKADNGFTKEHAAEAPEEIPLIGPGLVPGNPVEGTTEDLGDPRPIPSDIGDGAGPNIDSFGTDVGGSIRGGNSCVPAASFKIYLERRKHLRNYDLRYHHSFLRDFGEKRGRSNEELQLELPDHSAPRRLEPNTIATWSQIRIITVAMIYIEVYNQDYNSIYIEVYRQYSEFTARYFF